MGRKVKENELSDYLKKFFGFSKFKDRQEEIIYHLHFSITEMSLSGTLSKWSPTQLRSDLPSIQNPFVKRAVQLLISQNPIAIGKFQAENNIVVYLYSFNRKVYLIVVRNLGQFQKHSSGFQTEIFK